MKDSWYGGPVELYKALWDIVGKDLWAVGGISVRWEVAHELQKGCGHSPA